MTRKYEPTRQCIKIKRDGERCKSGAVDGQELCIAHLKRTPGSKEKAAARHARAAAEAVGVDPEAYNRKAINIIDFLAEIATDAQVMLDENRKHARISPEDGGLTTAGYSWEVLVKAATRIVDTVTRSALADEILRRARAEEHEGAERSAIEKLRAALDGIRARQDANLGQRGPSQPVLPAALPRPREPFPEDLRPMVAVLADIEQTCPHHAAFLTELEAVFDRWWVFDAPAPDFSTELEALI